MTEVRDVICRPGSPRALWFFATCTAAGAVAAAGWAVYRGPYVPWLTVAASLVLIGLLTVHLVTARVDADARGLRSRTLLRRWSVSWDEVADVRVRLRRSNFARGQESCRVGVVLRDGRERVLPLPLGRSLPDPEVQEKLTALRALHSHHGVPVSDHLVVVSGRTAGRGWAGSTALCVLLLVCAGAVGWFVPGAAATERAWHAAKPCTEATPATQVRECVDTLPAVIERTDVNEARHDSWLYFTDGRPLTRLPVSREAAEGFRPGDRVRLTVWRDEVMAVSGAHYVWHDGVTHTGGVADIAALFVLAAGYPAALTLLTLRGRRLPADEVLPSAGPFTFVLAGTALWLLPLCYLYPTRLLSSLVAIAWGVAGVLATSALFTRAWRATRPRTPQQVAVDDELAGEVFLAARFLDHTDYNPHGYGTHIALGDGPPAVAPGPGRFAARRIPVERLTVRNVRRAHGGDGETVPRHWNVAELDDGGRRVRLAAAPADLARILRELASERHLAGERD
ncbi:PH domain-containing protein [Streptomyces xylophagus]|uniref:PH domain-containing protein n=1 Tax=Streptomyces xylophagus TaxID=285514 RepID=UPI0005B96C1F|nr:PH domain-containing protein [Streptomyces xylophagus]